MFKSMCVVIVGGLCALEWAWQHQRTNMGCVYVYAICMISCLFYS